MLVGAVEGAIFHQKDGQGVQRRAAVSVVVYVEDRAHYQRQRKVAEVVLDGTARLVSCNLDTVKHTRIDTACVPVTIQGFCRQQ